jgi:SPP1 gp7 family putative phage head morphogenesis protein
VRAVFDQLEPEHQALAFTIAGIESAKVLQDVRDIIAELPLGANWDDVKRRVADDLSQQNAFIPNPDADAEEQAKARSAAEARSELLLRSWGFRAYANANYEMMDKQRDVFEHWQYITAGDDKVRDSHRALDGKVFPANSEFWKTHFPPWDYNCRCQCVPLSDGDVAEMREQDKDKNPEQRRVLDGAVLRKAEEGVVMNADGQSISVMPKTGAGAFQWTPGVLRVPVEQLKNRFDTESFSAFKEMMQRCAIEERPGVSVWDWLNGAELATPAEKLEGLFTGYENVIASKTREEMIAYAPDGKQLFGKFADAQNNLRLDPKQSALLEGATIIHNHPTDQPPSLPDLQTLLTDNPAALRIAGPKLRQLLQPPATVAADYEARVQGFKETALPTIRRRVLARYNLETERLMGAAIARQDAWNQAWPEIVRDLGLHYTSREAKR